MDAQTLQALTSLEQARQLNNCHAEIERLQAELDQERANNQTTYCAYCGKRFQLDDSAAVLVSEHIKTCEKHPLQDAMREVRRLEAKIDATLTAYRAWMDAQQAEVQVRSLADLGAGCYDPAQFPAWQAARAKAEASHFALLELLDRAAYPEKVNDGTH